MPKSYLERILRANVYDVARETPLESMHLLSERLGHNVLLKREDLQPVFSFKIRGAYNKIVQLDADQRARGVVCASAGNHAQGVALAAQKLGLRAVVVMPTTTPQIKSNAVSRLGGEVILHGVSVDESFQRAHAIADDEGMVFVHPFDDVDVIAGQGTIGHEILRQHGNGIDAIYVPVGGGGLIGGTAAWLREEACVVAVEPECCPTLSSALAAGKPVDVEVGGLATDALGASRIGDIGFASASRWVDESVLVPDASIRRAQWLLWNRLRLIAEPGGATALAGLVSGAFRPRSGGRVAVLVCGGNTDPAVVAGLSG